MAKKQKDATAEIEAELDGIQESARTDFELVNRLAGKSKRRKSVTIYTDSEAGAQLGYALDQTEGGIRTGRRVRRGIAGRIDQLEEEGNSLVKRIEHQVEAGLEVPEADTERAKEIQAELAKEKRKVTALKKRLEATAFKFTLHSLPDIIKRDMRRRARLNLGIRGKNVPADMVDEYELEHSAVSLVASVESWTDVEQDETHSSLSIERARTFRDYLPEGQFPRLERAMLELSYEVAIEHNATDDADF
ncbi:MULTISPECIES: hypothetical protein [unclassified Microbacterium]|uniref:hypothetical protein n=1 Tax=unclassified Microbacterium TaxID=2609290 RepID=UPI000EA973C6|nr:MULTISPECIES: hypothetical protein [unclassified Microbacterium]MBT2484856.1 hypothetical protein [Microbacterium sp. ISL-108]RKN67726.1 hypothetical protein D7252_09065 [Microbacterium sp. CGR2]